MKFRDGFVSNSSSSSFILQKMFLTLDQLDRVRSLVHAVPSTNVSYPEDAKGWSLTETDDTIEGHTWMDNFRMDEFFEEIGVPPYAVTFESDNGY